jgi:Protein of unknown function (DUF2924)
MNDQLSDIQAEKMAREIAALTKLTVKALKGRWRDLYGTEPPPRISPQLLTQAIAYRLQVRAFGGLKLTTRRLLDRVAEGPTSSPRPALPARKVSTGTLLVREWRGVAHQITVLDSGVLYKGQRHSSLSEVARLITGSRWSGPLFFGLRKPVQEARDGAV